MKINCRLRVDGDWQRLEVAQLSPCISRGESVQFRTPNQPGGMALHVVQAGKLATPCLTASLLIDKAGDFNP